MKAKEIIAAAMFLIWIILGSAGAFVLWFIAAPFVILSLWEAEVFEKETQDWLTKIIRGNGEHSKE